MPKRQNKPTISKWADWGVLKTYEYIDPLCKHGEQYWYERPMGGKVCTVCHPRHVPEHVC